MSCQHIIKYFYQINPRKSTQWYYSQNFYKYLQQYTVAHNLVSQHTAMIHDSQFDFYGNRLATCSSDGTVNIYDLSGEKRVVASFVVYQSRQSPLWSISWAHPRFGSILAVSSFDAEVSIWKEIRTNEWQKIAFHNGHSGSVNCVQWAPLEHDLILISCASDGTVIDYRRNNQQNDFVIFKKWQAHESAVNSVSWAHQDECLRIATAGADNSVKVWQLADDYMMLAQLDGHREQVRDVQWHPLNQMIASCSEDGAVIIWQCMNDNARSFQIDQELNLNCNVWRLSWSQIVGDKLVVSGYLSGETLIQVFQDEEGFLQLAQDLDQKN